MKIRSLTLLFFLSSFTLFAQELSDYWLSPLNAIYECNGKELICRYIPDEIYEKYSNWQDRIRLKDIEEIDDGVYKCYQFLNYKDNPTWVEANILDEKDKYLVSYKIDGSDKNVEFKKYNLTDIDKIYIYKDLILEEYINNLDEFKFNDIHDGKLRNIPMILSDNANIDLLEKSIDKLNNIDEPDEDGWTLLMYCIYNNSPKYIIGKIIENGATLDIVTTDDMSISPLNIAIFYNQNIDIIKYLLDEGASPRYKTENSVDAIFLAEKMNNTELLNLLKVY